MHQKEFKRKFYRIIAVLFLSYRFQRKKNYNSFSNINSIKYPIMGGEKFWSEKEKIGWIKSLS